MIEIEFADFYITNVCNLNCTDCNRFNNFTFKGHERWADYSAEYTKWAAIVDIKHIVILGGEPMLNPDFLLWVDGIMGLWPTSKVEILTNGTQFSRWPELYDRLKNTRLSVRMSAHSNEVMQNAQIGIDQFLIAPYVKSSANFVDDVSNSISPEAIASRWVTKYKQIKLADWPTCNFRSDFKLLPLAIQDECKELFSFDEKWGAVSHDAWIEKYNAIKGDSWPDCNSPDEFKNLPQSIQDECLTSFNFAPPKPISDGYKITDANGVSLLVMDSYKFYDTMLKQVGQTVKFQTGNGRIAHSNCCFTSVEWQAYQFARGRLWKCGPVAVFDEFSAQFAVDATTEQMAVATSYEPGNPNWEIAKIKKFINDLLYEIPACSLCPENAMPAGNPTNAGFKKIKILDHRYAGR
jgi:organic radical activating enzyme